MVATADEVIYARATGLADVANDTPMHLESIFRIASMTKAVTSAAAMQLVDANVLSLDSPIADYLDDFEPRPILLAIDDGEPSYSASTYVPTLRQLLTHTSGFAYGVWNETLFSITDMSAYTPTSFQSEPMMFAPGTRWHYSTSTDWVGLIVERASDMSLDAYFRQRITEPLGMTDTDYDLRPEQQSRVVTRHQRGPDEQLTEFANDPFQAATFYSGGAGLYSTAADYIRFMQAFLRDGGTVLSPEAVRAMGRNQIGNLEVGPMESAVPTFSNDFDIYPDSTAKFGLGFLINVDDIPGRRRAGSLTWGGLYNTYFWIDPESGICGVLLTQILPFFDAAVVGLLAEFETAVYESLDQK